jgi:ankyrin repeat protein
LFQSAGANSGEKFAKWINGKDRFGNTPVASVVHNCGIGYTEDDYTEVLEILLKHGPDLQSKDMYELTPLEFAKKFKKIKPAALLKAAVKGKLK